MSAASRIALAALAFVCVGVLSARPALAADALNYAQGYLLTGNYVASGVDITPQTNPPDKNGLSTATFHFRDSDKTSVPADADIVAAYLYYETLTDKSVLSEAKGATFTAGGVAHTILLNDFRSVKKSKQDLSGPLASCWSSGTPLTVTEFRVDVLRWLLIRPDKDGKLTGKRLVNDADLAAHGQPLYSVQLPTRSGNHVPESAGASLVIVYRDPASTTLRKVVLYDGVHVQSSLTEKTTQTIAGFYQSASSNKSAQITYLISSGQPNKNERIFFGDGAVAPRQLALVDPVTSSGPSSQRGWSTVKSDVSSLMNPVDKTGLTGFGETATTYIDHASGGAYDCLALSAVIFSTAVADVDADGLPDGLEDASQPLMDPDQKPGRHLPDLHMGGLGSSLHKDLYVEFNAMWAPGANPATGFPGTTYGSPDPTKGVPFALDSLGNVVIQSMTDQVGHTHMPTPEMLKLVGDAYNNAPVTNPDGTTGIRAHFDVGKWDAYHALGVAHHIDWDDDYTLDIADKYLVPSDYASGGEVIEEVACKPTLDPKTHQPTSHCQFPDFPGTVGWKFGLELYRDEPVGDHGEQISDYATWRKGSSHRRRFDRKRIGLYHYVLYAHARGNPQSDDPNNALLFHHPTTASGVADLPGANVLVSLGLWDDFVGRPFVRASTTLHELGHNLGLWHGGAAAVWGNAHPLNNGVPSVTTIEANCKPNYQSSMSYLFQVVGLVGRDGKLTADYSDRDFSDVWPSGLNETSLTNTSLWPSAKYQPAWFAPSDSPLAKKELASPPSHRFCDGTRFDANKPWPMMARVHAVDFDWTVNWSGGWNGAFVQGDNVNFDGVQPPPTPGKAQQPLPVQVFGTYKGFNDWANIRLDQMGAGRKTVKFQGGGDFADFGSGDFTDFGSGDFSDFGSGDFTDFGSGDFSDFGSGDFSDFGSGDFTDFGSGVFQIGSGDFSDFGSGDFADFGSGDFSDFGSGDFLDFGSGTERQELDYDTARALSPANPSGLNACVIGRDRYIGPDNKACLTALPNTSSYHRVELQFDPPTFGRVSYYAAERRLGDLLSTNPWVAVDSTSTTTTLIDLAELPNNQPFTYHVRAHFVDGSDGPWSDPLAQPVVAANDTPAPTADPDPTTTGPTAFGLNEDDRTGLTVNVLANDGDDDSPHTSLRATLVNDDAVASTLAGHGSVTLSTTGTFTYVPGPDFEGTITFHYTVNDGVWTDGVNTIAMSPDSTPSTAVTVKVISRHTTTSIISSSNPSVYGDQVTFTATVAPVTPDSERVAAGVPSLGTPTGAVTFSDTFNNITTVLGTGTLDGNGIATLTTSATQLAAGTHAITAAYCGDDEAYCGSVFYGSASDPMTQVVQKANATVSVTPYTVTYDGATHSATYTLAGVNGETGAAVGTVTLSTTHRNAGTYPDSWTFTGSANYNDIAATAVIDTINKRPVTVTADSKTKIYGNAEPALTYSITSGTLVSGDSFAGALFRNGYPSSQTVGTYAIEQHTLSLSPNYALTYVGANLTITQRPLTLVITNQTKSYGATLTFLGHGFTITNADANSGLVSPDSVTSATLTSDGAVGTASAGTYAINGSDAVGSGLSNYTITFTPGTLTVNPAPLRITANNASKDVGTTLTFSGTEFTTAGTFYNGDSVTSVTLTSAGASSTAAAGTYTIVPSSATGTGVSNYSITYFNGTLTVR